MKTKIVLLLSIIMLTSVNAFAEFEYKGEAKENHVKKAQFVGFGVDGTLHGRGFGNRGIYGYDSYMDFCKLHNFFYISYHSEDENGNNIEQLYIEFNNRPYIEKNTHGTITIIGQCGYSYKNTPHIENTKDNCRLFITLTPTNEPYNSFLLYTCKIYEGSENTEPLFEKKLDRPYFYETPFGASDFRDLRDKPECYKYFWLWLEHITNKLK